MEARERVETVTFVMYAIVLCVFCCCCCLLQIAVHRARVKASSFKNRVFGGADAPITEELNAIRAEGVTGAIMEVEQAVVHAVQDPAAYIHETGADVQYGVGAQK